MVSWLRGLAVGLAVMGCRVDEAPAELAELSGYLYGVWDHPDDRVREDAIRALERQLEAVDDLEGSPPVDRSWSILPLQPEHVQGITRPDRPLEATVNVALAFVSPWSIEDHARLQAETDQTPVETTAPRYRRDILEPEDPECFVRGECEILDTFNDLRRQNLLMRADMELLKVFRWVPYTDDQGRERNAFYSRSWFEQSWPGDRENVWLYQSYSIDVWIERPGGEVWRYQTLWSETELGIAAGDNAVAATVRQGTEGTMKAGDDAISELYHGGQDAETVRGR